MKLLHEDGTVTPIIKGSPLTIGRDPKNSVQLNDATVSPFHATISVEAGIVLITDEKSATGVIVNDRRIRKRITLRNQDKIIIGLNEFQFLNG